MSEELSPEHKEQARAIFEGEIEDRSACCFCGGLHTFVAKLRPHLQPCPRIKSVERHMDGTVLKLEHWPPGTWEADVIFPSDVYDD